MIRRPGTAAIVGPAARDPSLFYTRHWGGQVRHLREDLVMFAKIYLWVRRLERDPNAKNYTDEALRTSDDYVVSTRKCINSPRRREGEADRGA